VGRSAESYLELARKIQVRHNTVKKHLTKVGVHRKATISAPTATARQQSVNKAYRLQLLTQNFFSAKSIYKCVMDDEFYFTVEGNDEWQQQSYYESVDHPATGF
jgi:nitrogen regulatory protein PII